MPDYPPTPRSTLRRLPARGSYDQETIHAVIDAALVCHVAFIDEGLPVSIPTSHARVGNRLLFHGALNSRLMRHLCSGGEVSISFALVDGLVAVRSIFNHAQNYRSAVVFGRGQAVEGEAAVLEALRAYVEWLIPGRWDEVRLPTPAEIRATAVAAVEIEAASAKIRAAGPGESAEDAASPLWHGLVPLQMRAGPPESDSPGPLPASIQAYLRRFNGD